MTEFCNIFNAYNDLLDDNIFLSQQDYGNLLEPENRMKWFDPSQCEGSENLEYPALEFGKAMCFYRRKDGVMVGISKCRWITLSSDGGKTWSQPDRLKSLITGNEKGWASQQQTESIFSFIIPIRINAGHWPYSPARMELLSGILSH